MILKIKLANGFRNCDSQEKVLKFGNSKSVMCFTSKGKMRIIIEFIKKAYISCRRIK